ncbi:MAG: 50S ribosomal protein L4 [Pseudonocardiales bacterium]|nr:50S ribosomal protein L4 [Pseudonocardiales bacterium]
MSTKIKVRTPGGGTDGSVELPAEVFDVAANMPLMHQVVIGQLAAARQGTHSTKTRGDVRGGGRKPYRQKGTGRARQGSIRSPQFAGGGIAHGPHPRDYSQKTPKKMKAAALRSALSDRARSGRVHVISGVVDDQTPSTKSARTVVAALTDRPRVLVVISREDQVAWLSLRNLPNVHVIAPDQLNTYDVLVSEDVVFTTEALNAFLAMATRGRLGSDATDTDAPTKPAAKKAAPRAAKPAAAKAVKVEAVEAAAEPKAAAKSTTKAASKAAAATAEPKAEPKAAEPKAAESKAAAKAPAKARVAKAPAEGPHGAGSHEPLPDGGEPEGFPIKGNASSMLYHLPGTSAYKRTVAEVWFATEKDAKAAGFQLPPSQRSAAKEKKQ